MGNLTSNETNVQHVVIFTDMVSGGVRVVDLDILPSDKEITLTKEDTIWSFERSEDNGWDMSVVTRRGIDDAKLRYSNYHRKYVVLMTASGNWAGIAEYPSGKCLWETRIGVSPHSIEMLPNGDVVIAVSGEDSAYPSPSVGRVIYYHLQEDATYQLISEVPLRSAHGAWWDSGEQIIWALGMDGLVAYKVTPQYHLKLIEGKGFEMLCGGHALSVDYQNPNYLWIGTAINKVIKFSIKENQIIENFDFSDIIIDSTTTLANTNNVKGITSFSDGTIAFCKSVHCSLTGEGTIPGYATNKIYLLGQEGIKTYAFTNLYLYKLNNFVSDYGK